MKLTIIRSVASLLALGCLLICGSVKGHSAGEDPRPNVPDDYEARMSAYIFVKDVFFPNPDESELTIRLSTSLNMYYQEQTMKGGKLVFIESVEGNPGGHEVMYPPRNYPIQDEYTCDIETVQEHFSVAERYGKDPFQYYTYAGLRTAPWDLTKEIMHRSDYTGYTKSSVYFSQADNKVRYVVDWASERTHPYDSVIVFESGYEEKKFTKADFAIQHCGFNPINPNQVTNIHYHHDQ